MLDELKSKLGFGGGAVRGRSNDRYDDYDDDYGDYEDDYSEYAEYADDSENDYDPYAPVTTRSARSNSTISNLVSINDVRAHSRGEGSSSTPTSSARRMTTAHTPYRGERTTVDSSLPPTMTPEGSAAVAAAASRAELAVRADGGRVEAGGQACGDHDPVLAYGRHVWCDERVCRRLARSLHAPARAIERCRGNERNRAEGFGAGELRLRPSVRLRSGAGRALCGKAIVHGAQAGELRRG